MSTSPSSGERLLELQEAAPDVAEVDVEDFPAVAEPTNHVVDLLAGFLEHFGNRALTKIQAVIPARHRLDETLQSVHRAEHGVHATEAGLLRHGWVLRMQRDSHLRFLGYGHDPFQEIRDAVPVDLLADRPRLGKRRLLFRLRV